MHALFSVSLLCWPGSKDEGPPWIPKRHRLQPLNYWVNLRRSNKQLLTKRMGRTPMFLYVFMFEFHMFRIHFFMLHVHQHTCTVL